MEKGNESSNAYDFAACFLRPVEVNGVIYKVVYTASTIFVRLNLSSLLISHGTLFFSHNKTTSAGLSTVEIKPSAEQPIQNYIQN